MCDLIFQPQPTPQPWLCPRNIILTLHLLHSSVHTWFNSRPPYSKGDLCCRSEAERMIESVWRRKEIREICLPRRKCSDSLPSLISDPTGPRSQTQIQLWAGEEERQVVSQWARWQRWQPGVSWDLIHLTFKHSMKGSRIHPCKQTPIPLWFGKKHLRDS